jgi:lipid A ethanolaminephosphotransferase
MYINPTYPVYSLVKTLIKKHQGKTKVPLKIIAADASKPPAAHKFVFVMVVGETARAEQFSLNGYKRETNPELMKMAELYNFSDVEACGTDTAESLPCMFSHLDRNSYSRNEAFKHENILDILQRTGVNVFWLDNNSGSKGVADRIPTISLSHEKNAALCSAEECFDEIILERLDRLLAQNQGDMLLVLHQKGSHGPSYYKRSPAGFKRYQPECTQDNVQDCEQQSIINAYDNTIVYTDHFLARLIRRLTQENYPTAMLYASDHGESLGENNIYLHGLPFSIAPGQQTHIPMIFWGSAPFMRDKGVDTVALKNRLNDHYSHDNLFHTLLGVFEVRTEIYKPGLDILNKSRILH